MTTNEVSPDLLELYEYDEFDSYEEHLNQAIVAAKETASDGVPLSVELSESLHSNQSVNEERNTDASEVLFEKAPEIFLRIGAPETETECEIKLKLQSEGHNVSVESIDNNDVLLVTDGADECIELQYENEFEDSTDDVDCNVAHSSNRPKSFIEDEYEQLLFEGTD